MVRPSPAGELDAVALETALLDTWKNEETFQKSIDSNREGAPFIFLEGPPTANGKPGIHHVVARAYKDLVCRWKSMEGFLVERKGGWDTHGLPVEIEVQKRLDLMSNEAIENFGMQAFNDACRESVWTYESAWREMTERMAYWVDLDNPYVTLENDYVESCWWALKQMFDKNLLYRGHKVLPYCPQTGTSYSSHEVALGYKEVEEPSVYVKFKLVDDSASILAWTTTPWTLPGNVGLAVGPEVTYARCRVREEPEGWQGRGGASVGEELILAKDLMGEVLRHHVDILEEIPGSSLVGKSYEPLFPDAVPRGDSTTAWTVLSADWVTTTDGTGVVTPPSCTVKMTTISEWKWAYRRTTPSTWKGTLSMEYIPNSMDAMSNHAMIQSWKFWLVKTVRLALACCTVRRVTCTITHTAGEQIIHFSTTQWIPGSFE